MLIKVSVTEFGTWRRILYSENLGNSNRQARTYIRYIQNIWDTRELKRNWRGKMCNFRDNLRVKYLQKAFYRSSSNFPHTSQQSILCMYTLFIFLFFKLKG